MALPPALSCPALPTLTPAVPLPHPSQGRVPFRRSKSYREGAEQPLLGRASENRKDIRGVPSESQQGRQSPSLEVPLTPSERRDQTAVHMHLHAPSPRHPENSPCNSSPR
ncbi:Hypothetical predicted protein [Marmota monax]|uniref:Uncharacterized protein n=1 Tax=Marmota monax TaxID=9995 RepID=A0A5E4BSZ9_MARMO|nr:Hypothetical predicted protein [Marmota monax]